MTRFTLKSILGGFVAGSLLIGSGLASATTITECKALIGTLKTQTAAAVFLGRNAAKDELGLIGKLDEASNKLDVAKLADATLKVSQYRDKVNAVKIAGDSPVSGAELIEGANGVLSCIGSIGY